MQTRSGRSRTVNEDALAHENISPRVGEECADQVETRKWSLEHEPHEIQFEKRNRVFKPLVINP